MNTCLIFTHPINAFAIHVCNKILRPNLDGVIFDLDQNGSLGLLDTESLLKNQISLCWMSAPEVWDYSTS